MFAYCRNQVTTRVDDEGTVDQDCVSDEDDLLDESWQDGKSAGGNGQSTSGSGSSGYGGVGPSTLGSGSSGYSGVGPLTFYSNANRIATSGRGAQNPKVQAAIKKGQEMHVKMDYGPGVEKEKTIAPGCRVDGIDINNHIIFELKPNNPQAIARGLAQLKRYTSAASQYLGGQWLGVLILYN